MSKGRLKIIHITDLHFYEFPKNMLSLFNKRILGCLNWELNRKKRFDFTRVEQFLKVLNQYKNSAVMISGDLTVTAHEKEFYLAKRFIDNIRMGGFPVYVIPGNHDYYTFEAVRRRRYETIFKEYCLSDAYPTVIPSSDGTSLVFLHTVRPNIISSRGEIDNEQIQKLKEIVSSLKSPSIVCGHYPILHQTPEYYSSYSRRLKNADSLRKVLIQTKVPLLYIAGHVHHYSLNRDEVNPLVTYLCSPPLFYSQQRNGGYCEITIENNQFHIQLKNLY